MVRLQPRGLVRDEAVADAVRLVERVVGERLDRVEVALRELGGVTVADAALDELAPLLRDELADLLAGRLAQVVGFFERVAGELLRRAHQLLLVDHQPVGGAEDLLEIGMVERHRLAAVLAVGVLVVPVLRHRARPVQRDHGGDVFEGLRIQRAQERPHRPAFELEDAHRVGLLQQGEGLGIVEREVVDVGPLAGRPLDEVERDLHHVEVAQTEEVHLQQPEVFDPVHLVLRDHRRVFDGRAGLRLALDRDVLGERLAGDHDRGRVDAVLAPQAFETERDVDHAARVGIVVAELAQLVRHLVAVDVLLVRLEARVQRCVAAHDQRRHELRDLVADEVGVSEHARAVAHRGPGLDRRERDHLRDVVVAVLLRRVPDHLAAVARVEVHVDVGHLLAARVEHPLEQQVVLDRVDVDDAQAVRDARTGRAPPPRPDADAARLGVAHEVPDHEEVRGEAHRLHDVELVLDALDHVRRGRGAVALARALHRELAQVRVLVVAFGDRERRQDRLAELDLDVGALRDQQRVVARVGELAEQVAHLGRRLDVEVVAVELEALGIRLERAGLHAEERVVGLGVFLVRVVAVVRGEQGRLEAARDVEERANDPNVVLETVVLELDEEVIAPEDVLEARRGFEGSLLVAGEDQLRDQPTQAPTRGGDALVMTFEQLPVAARLVVVAVEKRGARDLDEVAVALVGLGEHREVEDLVLGALRAARSATCW